MKHLFREIYFTDVSNCNQNSKVEREWDSRGNSGQYARVCCNDGAGV